MNNNKNSIIVSLDVGGTSVKGAAVSQDAQILGRVREIPSPSRDDADIIIGKFVTLLQDIKDTAVDVGCHKSLRYRNAGTV